MKLYWTNRALVGGDCLDHSVSKVVIVQQFTVRKFPQIALSRIGPRDSTYLLLLNAEQPN